MAASVGATALAPERTPAEEGITNWREALHAALAHSEPVPDAAVRALHPQLDLSPLVMP